MMQQNICDLREQTFSAPCSLPKELTQGRLATDNLLPSHLHSAWGPEFLSLRLGLAAIISDIGCFALESAVNQYKKFASD